MYIYTLIRSYRNTILPST